ncbi:Doxorubicin resistance ATP-binding protein DrrA [archaeon HR06]|nr:Doxorubicin resistance ATP-binding protein DrrA [archaeon HR06]
MVKVEELTKKYGDFLALNKVSFSIEEGEVFGFLGPNGAGKTTIILILITLLKPTSGRATVAGYDVVKEASKVRSNIGYVSQDITVDDYLTGRENLIFQAKLYNLNSDIIDKRIYEVLSLLDLLDRADEQVSRYSGGMKRRLDIACGLIHTPKVLFLDEPTLGLDASTRRKIWEYIKRLKSELGITIFLTTHYMEEADALCDRVAIIDRGEIKALDKPSKLKSNMGDEVIILKLKNSEEEFIDSLYKLQGIKEVKVMDDKCFIKAKDGEKLIPEIFEMALNLKVKIESISFNKPSLEDVFLYYTGKKGRRS